MKLFFFLFFLFFAAQFYWFVVFYRIWGWQRWYIAMAVALLGLCCFFYANRFVMGESWWFEFARNTGYMVMALTMTIVPLLFVLDALHGVRLLYGYAFGAKIHAYWWGKHYLLYGLFLGLFFCAVGIFNAFSPKVVEYTLETNKLPVGAKPVRLVHLTDVHIGGMIGVWSLQRLANSVNKYEPDIVVSTGDLTDVGPQGHAAEIAALRSIKAPLGKYASLGNHERYRLPLGSLALTEQSGFTLLRNEHVKVGGIIIAGIDDPAFLDVSPQTVDELPMLSALPEGVYTILLKHRPDIAQQGASARQGASLLFDLQLSGHTHNGQMWPGSLVTDAMYGKTGLRLLDAPARSDASKKYLLLSNGVGFWGPPVRLLAPAQVIVVTITPVQKDHELVIP